MYNAHMNPGGAAKITAIFIVLLALLASACGDRTVCPAGSEKVGGVCLAAARLDGSVQDVSLPDLPQPDLPSPDLTPSQDSVNPLHSVTGTST
jgi:hypothetical protein